MAFSQVRLICAVRGCLDFIYYAHFESHTMDSLVKLYEAWVLFHTNKHYFVDMEVRQHFNIPKIHSMQHYVMAIISRGSADGFNTESPECLHIDFAKNTYRATNRKNYIKQMTKWLTHQEACHRFANYLQWTVLGYLAELSVVSEVKENDDENDELDDPDSPDQFGGLGYSVAKEPAYPQTRISSLVNDFHVADFLPHLHTFLCTSSHTSRSAIAPTLNTELPVYKCLTVRLPPAPQVTKLMTKDVIRARQAVPAHGPTPAVPSQFDTVLARESDLDEDLEHPLDGKSTSINYFHNLQSQSKLRADSWPSLCHLSAS